MSSYAQEPTSDFLSRACEEVKELYPNMRVVSQLYQLLRDPESSLDDAIQLIKSEGIIATGVIRLSNSAHFGKHGESSDLTEAVQKVGFRETLRLVGGFMSSQLFMKDLAGYGLTSDEYWTYSYYCAAFLESVSIYLGENSDNAYLIGLLHGIGRVVNNELLSDQEVEILWDPTLPCEEWERIMGLPAYPEAGQRILQAWDFPENICDFIRRQLDLDFQNTQPLAMALDFARQTAEGNRPAIGKWGSRWHFAPEIHPFHAQRDLGLEKLETIHHEALERVQLLQNVLKA